MRAAYGAFVVSMLISYCQRPKPTPPARGLIERDSIRFPVRLAGSLPPDLGGSDPCMFSSMAALMNSAPSLVASSIPRETTTVRLARESWNSALPTIVRLTISATLLQVVHHDVNRQEPVQPASRLGVYLGWSPTEPLRVEPVSPSLRWQFIGRVVLRLYSALQDPP